MSKRILPEDQADNPGLILLNSPAPASPQEAPQGDSGRFPLSNPAPTALNAPEGKFDALRLIGRAAA